MSHINQPSLPIFTIIKAASPYYAYIMDINEYLYFTFHVPHDYAPGTNVYLRTHWMVDTTMTKGVKWNFIYTYAKGWSSGTFDQTGTTVSIETAANGTKYRHHCSEIATGILGGSLEPDALIYTTVKRVANQAGNDDASTDHVFLLGASLHYEADRLATPLKETPWY
jgi:hypothetical protein